MIEKLKDYSSIMEIPVAWGEMDSFQHVNNVAYIRYLESARTNYFLELDYLDYMKEKGVGPILASISCKYKAPLTFPDTIYVGSKVYKMSDTTFWIKHEIFSKKLQKITTEGEGVIVSYDYNLNKKCTIPEIMRKTILEKENNNIELIV